MILISFFIFLQLIVASCQNLIIIIITFKRHGGRKTMKTIRLATLEDAERILEIYNPFITNTTVTFEYEPLNVEDFRQRMQTIMSKYPFIVCEIDNQIAGYAYCSPFNPRAAYSWDCDSSIYVDPSFHGNGIGRFLYESLFKIMKELGYYNIYALVTDPNPTSLAFHKRLGFILEGFHEAAGYKFNRWLGINRLVKRIGDFDKTPEPVKSIQEVDINSLIGMCNQNYQK